MVQKLKSSFKKPAMRASSGRTARVHSDGGTAATIIRGHPSNALQKKSKLLPATLITYGSATIEGAPFKSSVIKRNVASGQLALRRAKSVLSRSGVRLKVGSGVPRYEADSINPSDLVIRVLDGVSTRGRFINGKFRPTP